jgi:hypothetical protein
MKARDIRLQDFRVESDRQSFFVTAIYHGPEMQFGYSDRGRSVSLRIKFHFYHSGAKSGVKPTATIEAMLLPSPGTWNMIDELHGDLQANMDDLSGYTNEFIRAEALQYVERNRRRNGEITDDIRAALQEEADSLVFPKMREEKFTQLLEKDIDELLRIACCVL